MVDTGHVVLCEQGVGLRRLGEIGRRLARSLRAGDLVLLYGPMGAGKTALIRVIADTLGVSDPVRSPSFTIANIYAGPIMVRHLDLYRLDEIGEDDALAVEDYTGGEAVTLVEWPEAGLARLGSPAWIVRIGHESRLRRSVEIEASTSKEQRLWDASGDVDG